MKFSLCRAVSSILFVTVVHGAGHLVTEADLKLDGGDTTMDMDMDMEMQPPTTEMGTTTPLQYTDGDNQLLGHLALPTSTESPVPAIIIIPDWDGVNEYEQNRTTMIANNWGLVGFAADIYGADLQTVENVTERIELANFYRSNPDIFGSRIQTAVELVKALPEVDETRVALFGYCFGGTGVLQYGMFGNDDVNAMVSFHGGLAFLPEEPLEFGPKLLVLSGGEDDAVTDIMDLEITLDSANATWEITRYSDIDHAFTVFGDDRYNAWADMRSWEAAYDFVLEAFDIIDYVSARPSMTTTSPVDYTDPMDGMALRGHVAIPSDEWERPLPAIVVLPDWDGSGDGYEMERATALAELGYVAMVADIYGADLQFVESIDDRGALVGQYSGNPMLYMSRMETAIEQLKNIEDVNANEIGMIGYCFGGSGAVLYSFFGGNDAKVAVAFHGSFTELPPVQVEEISPYLLVLSGGDDGLHGNQTIMESAFNSGNADWEITRYAGVDHGFTSFESPAYNLAADARSWESMLLSFQELLAMPKIIVDDTNEAPGMEISPPADADIDNNNDIGEEDDDSSSNSIGQSSLQFLIMVLASLMLA